MIEFKVVTDLDLLKATLFNRSQVDARGCWVWQRGKRAGYGQLQVNKKTCEAHRASYTAFTGEIIPPNMVVRHTCDNPSCINPAHLVIGTVADNVADREARGRRDVKGEQVGTAKLTEQDVQLIRMNLHQSGVRLAALFGVSTSTISLIRQGKGWRHVSAAATAGENDGR